MGRALLQKRGIMEQNVGQAGGLSGALAAGQGPGRVILMVLDGCGVGAMPDAPEYGDDNANTVRHALEQVQAELPHLSRLGLGTICPAPGLPAVSAPLASFGKMAEASRGKDTATGHWEIMGVVTQVPFITFPNGFPADLMEEFSRRVGRGYLCNLPASGTEIIQALGEQHQKTGDLIVYTSADSVFQIAAHEETVPLEELYRICELAYELVTPRGVARVIARPFTGTPGHYKRTENRHDYTVPPPSQTVMQTLTAHHIPVTGVGKIRDIYAGEGVSHHVKATNNRDITARTLELVQSERSGLIFANLVDFDMLYGHRRDPVGFAGALKAFDNALPDFLSALKPDDLLLLTADHGNDPTFHGTDHCREYVPILAYSPRNPRGRDLGIRGSFADLGATVAEYFGVPDTGVGRSFLAEVRG